jgi:TRAP-type C4-dicarboxylate transport system permease large subunit
MVLTLVATASLRLCRRADADAGKDDRVLVAISSNKYVLMWLNIGCWCWERRHLALLLICTPILLPVVKSFGIDPAFGIVMPFNLGIGPG